MLLIAVLVLADLAADAIVPRHAYTHKYYTKAYAKVQGRRDHLRTKPFTAPTRY
ncbi:MAG: hypothetical protein NVS3B25_25180 [Hymenobacter sp.]